MIKASINDMLPVYYKLFNLILYSGTMPSSTWCDGLAWPHYSYLRKSGNKQEPLNYRGTELCFKLPRKIILTILLYYKSKTFPIPELL